MSHESTQKKLQPANDARRWLIDSLREHLLPRLFEQGFISAPLVHRGPVDREFVLRFPLGRLRRTRSEGVDLAQIELAKRGHAAFRIRAGVAPKEGLMTFTGHWAAEDLYADWLDEFFQMTPKARATAYFGVRHWPWQNPSPQDYQKLVERVVGFLPELELALREGRLGPHMLRVAIPQPAPPSATSPPATE